MQDTADVVHELDVIEQETGNAVEYDAIFDLLREAGEFELTIDVTGSGGISSLSEHEAERVTESVGNIGLIRNQDGVEGSGEILTADIIEERLHVRIDNPNVLSPSDIMEMDNDVEVGA